MGAVEGQQLVCREEVPAFIGSAVGIGRKAESPLQVVQGDMGERLPILLQVQLKPFLKSR